MKLSSAVGAKQQACKQARPSGFRISAFMAAKLLHTVKQIFGYDRLLHIRNDLLLLYGVVDLLVNLEADRCTFEVYRAPGVRPIFKNVLYSFVCP